MTITSFSFLALISIGVVFYYIVPKAWQWELLLVLSIAFYFFAGTPYTIIYLVVSTITAYAFTLLMKKLWGGAKSCRKIKVVFVIAILINVALWLVFKGKEFWQPVGYEILKHKHISSLDTVLNFQLISALGMGYYTLQILGYMIDCYWGNIEPQRNPVKLFLFIVYFPQLTTGPISRYSEMNTLYDKHYFKYQNLSFGAQRILWGFVKKLVLAERVGLIVSGITADPDTYTGFYSWLVILLYPIQMYADFSGCMDIVLGTSELFDIHLAENFRNPFFSRSSQEFWQRWHITLGSWAKDYVLYPLLKSKWMIQLGKSAKKKFGKKKGKFIISATGMFVLWMVMGVWHGGVKYVVGVSLWYWIILMLGELLAPAFFKITDIFHMKTESFSWHLFQSSRTYMIYAIGAAFFSVGVGRGIELIQDAWRVIVEKDYANPWIFFDGSVLDLGITYGDINIIIIAVALLFIVGFLREKYVYARIWVQRQGFMFRWFVWIALFLFVLIYGKYGPGYNAADFIYQGF